MRWKQSLYIPSSPNAHCLLSSSITSAAVASSLSLHRNISNHAGLKLLFTCLWPLHWCVFVQLWTRWVWVGNGGSKVQLVSGVGRVRKQPCVGSISGGGWKVGRRLMRKTGSPLGQPSLWTAAGILLSYIFGHPGNNGTRLRKGRGARDGEEDCTTSGSPRKGRDGQILGWDGRIGPPL